MTDPFAVAGRVDVRGCDVGDPGPAGLADHAQLIVFGQRALQHGEARFHDRRVDHLALAAAHGIAPVERHQDALDREQAGQGVAQRDSGARRRLVGEAVDVAQPAHGLADTGEAGAVGVGAGLSETGNAQMISRGLTLCRLSGPRAHFSNVPGLKFSTRTSASAASLRTRSCPLGSRRLAVTDSCCAPAPATTDTFPDTGDAPIGASDRRCRAPPP